MASSGLEKTALGLIFLGVIIIILGLIVWIFEDNHDDEYCGKRNFRARLKQNGNSIHNWLPIIILGLGILFVIIGLVLYFVGKAKSSGKQCNLWLSKYNTAAGSSTEIQCDGTIVRRDVLKPVIWADCKGGQWVPSAGGVSECGCGA